MKVLRISGILVAIFIMLLSYSGSGFAATYLTDSIDIPLRADPNPRARTLENLSSGQTIEVIENQGDWSHIRIQKADGTQRTGWVPSRLVVSRPPWEIQARNLEKENASLKEQLSGLQELQRKNQQAADALQKLQSDYDTLRNGSASYLQLKEEYESVQSKLSEAESTLQLLRDENSKLRISQQLQWFLAGGSVMLIGWLFGLIMGRSQKKRHSYRLS